MKRGLICTIAICASLIIFRNQIPPIVAVTAGLLKGHHSYCPLIPLLSSYSLYEQQEKRTQEIKHRAKYVAHDRSYNLDLYDIESQKIWMPTGELWNIATIIAEQERQIYECGSATIKTGDIVLDVGAHIGLYARHALGLGAARVIAFEPEPIALECFRRNLKNEIQSGNVVVCAKGAWNRNDFLEMSFGQYAKSGASFMMSDGSQTMRLPLTTIDSIVTDLKLPSVDFIKMDIEGAEHQALAGAANAIRKFHPRMAICIYHHPDDPIAIPATVRSIVGDYHQICGSCMFTGGVVAEVSFFF